MRKSLGGRLELPGFLMDGMEKIIETASLGKRFFDRSFACWPAHRPVDRSPTSGRQGAAA